MKKILLCKDCKYSKGWNEFLTCHHPKNMRMNYAYGKEEPRWTYCSTLRLGSWLGAILFDSCGNTARWFEPK